MCTPINSVAYTWKNGSAVHNYCVWNWECMVFTVQYGWEDIRIRTVHVVKKILNVTIHISPANTNTLYQLGLVIRFLRSVNTLICEQYVSWHFSICCRWYMTMQHTLIMMSRLYVIWTFWVHFLSINWTRQSWLLFSDIVSLYINTEHLF